MKPSNSSDNLSDILATFWDEISPKVDAYAIPSIQSRIAYWVDQNPTLTKVLCDYAVQHASQIKEGDAEDKVDKIVHSKILLNWENSPAGSHLKSVQDSVLSHERGDSLLIVYIQILQRGRIGWDGSAEQQALLESGIVEEKEGYIEVANRLYAEVFNLSWVESQIPGITKPVTIVSSKTANGTAASATAKLYSKLAIAACGLAVVGAAISSYVRESGGEAMANPDDLADVALVEPAAERESSQTGESAAANRELSEPSPQLSDRALFDSGEEHAKNSRWVQMVRNFCELSPESAYFVSAQKDLVRWQKLYPEDLKIATDLVVAERNGQCAVNESLAQ